MPQPNHIKNIALVGATGNVGSQILHHLLQSSPTFNITVVTRSDSKATLPEDNTSVTVKRGSYDDTTFLSTVFANQDVLILALGFMAMDHQKALIEAAVKAGVEWILPTEYAGDGANEAMIDRVPLFWPKREARRLISKLAAEQAEGQGEGRSKFIAVVTNPWVPFSLQTGMFGIDPYERKVTLYEDAGGFNVSTLEQVGRGVARLLNLPVKDEGNPRASLQHYANGFVYISSALTTQRELFGAALKVTGTTEADWDISRSSCAERLRVAEEKFAQGDMMAGADGTYAVYMGEGMGGDYENKAAEDRKVLGLETESVEGFVKSAVEMGAFRVGG